MANTKLILTLNGDNSSQIRELHDLELLATFENGNAQANISTTEFEFVNDFAQEIRNWIDGGLTGGYGIFQGIPLTITLTGQQPPYLAFAGYLDMTDDFQINNPTSVTGKIKKDNGLQNLNDLASGLTWEYLWQEGILTLSDMEYIPYVIEKEFSFVEFALLVFTIYTMTVQLIDLIKSIAQDIASGVVAPLQIALEIVYAVLLIVYLIELTIDLMRMLIQPIKFTRGMRLKKLLELGSSHLNYGYNTTIQEINDNFIVLLPSKDSVDEQDNADKQRAGITIYQDGPGFPNARDYGYTFGEILALVNKTFNAKLAIKNGVIEQHSLNSSWWYQQSTYQMPDILLESKKFNTDELQSNMLLTFTPDSQDKNVMENYKGTSYEVITTPISTPNIQRVCLKGLDEIEIPYALGIRKNSRNIIEALFDTIISIVTEIKDFINTFTSGGTQLPPITSRIGVLKLETDFINVPKMLYLSPVDFKLPVNYHDLWSAKVLYNRYHIQKSFVGNSFTNTNQWIIHEGVRIPFGFADFLSLIDNAYFYDINGNPAQVTKIQWSVSKDFAVVDYKINDLYTKNLKEQFVEVGLNFD
tara:strand:- start:3435 stop:5189 length:1755 start_codon:yes stop_codon:yes gene_type:complete